MASSTLARIRHSWSKVKAPTSVTKKHRDSSDSSISPATTTNSSTAPAQKQQAVATTPAPTQMTATAMTQLDPHAAAQNPLQPLLGRVYAVTGGASGIGLATARTLSRRGATVCIADVDAEAMKTAGEYFASQGVEVPIERVDVSKRKEVDGWIESIIARYGRLDGAANVAGVIGKCHGISTVAELEDDDWDRIIGVNLTGTFYCLRAQLRNMNSGGSIVNVSSIHGLKGTHANWLF